ncbi:restriction endonuclease subunit S [Helicobacter pylori]|uniref:restriction endonuclease subunit S n=1 Tax=Helicobacter pylori TaxID=210 RepID=UPI0030BC925A
MDALTTPSNWQRVRLGDMTTSFTKQTGFDYSDFIKPTLIKEYLPNYIPFIQNKDFLGHYINYKTDYFIPNEIAIRFPQILLNEKCLLISISGAIGNVAVFNHSQDAFIGGAIAVLKFKEKKSLDFVMHFLMSASGQKLLLNGVKSSSHKNLTIADLRDLLIPLPPLDEQIAIANILSDVDHYLYSLDALILKKEGVKKALRIKMLNQILASNGVEFKKIGEICLIKRGRVIAKKILQENGKYPVYSSQTLNNGILGFIDTYDFDGEFLTWTTDGAYAGSVFYRNGRFSITNVCGLLQVIQDNILHKYLYYILQITAPLHVNPGMGNPKLMSVAMQQIQIPLPPLNEQIAIANILSDLDHEIISLKNKKRQFENIKKALNHDLMSAKIRVLKK